MVGTIRWTRVRVLFLCGHKWHQKIDSDPEFVPNSGLGVMRELKWVLKMKVGDLSPSHCITALLRQSGYVFFPKWRCGQSTMDIGRWIGSVVDIQALLPRSGIPTVQTLSPRHTRESSSNRYSGTYGLADFPLHTDLAHWARPPRYLILRCRSGAASVATNLLPSSALISRLGTTTVRRAVARPRRLSGIGKQCLLPLMFSANGACGLRWDPLFLIPMNSAAQQVAEFMSANAWEQANLVTITLACPGDTLIVDNWQFLHGRSAVPPDGAGRRIERVYLSELDT